MAHFPLFVDLKDQPVLVVGGGTVALRKVRKLLPYGPRIIVVAPEICPELGAVPGVGVCPRRFHLRDLRPRPALVLAATDDPAQNHRIAALYLPVPGLSAEGELLGGDLHWRGQSHGGGLL